MDKVRSPGARADDQRMRLLQGLEVTLVAKYVEGFERGLKVFEEALVFCFGDLPDTKRLHEQRERARRFMDAARYKLGKQLGDDEYLAWLAEKEGRANTCSPGEGEGEK